MAKNQFLAIMKAMIFDGKKCAQEIKDSLKTEFLTLPKKPRLDIIYAGSDPAIESFLRMKIRVGEDIGAETIVHRFPANIAEKDLISEISKTTADPISDGTIVQLPLPVGLNVNNVLDALPPEKDVDVLSNKALDLFSEGRIRTAPPVAGAMLEIFKKNNIDIQGKNAVVLGKGRLVGLPASFCLKRAGANVTDLNSATGDPTPYLLKADIIISGIGKAHFIKPDMIRDGVILIDCGTSESSAGIAGDADPTCAEKCSLFTPVPGGVGPMTVALIYKNLMTLMKK